MSPPYNNAFKPGDLVEASCYPFKWTGVVTAIHSNHFIYVHGPLVRGNPLRATNGGHGETAMFHIDNLKIVEV